MSILKTTIDGFYSDYGLPPYTVEDVKTDIPFEIEDQWIKQDDLKVLFGHFSPFVNGIGSIDFPLFFSKLFPNATVHVTYDKGIQDGPVGFSPKDIFLPFEIKKIHFHPFSTPFFIHLKFKRFIKTQEHLTLTE